ncbi:SNF5-domain-containing protein [Pseudovirgaria hyperparasitica]|uniref:SNF5-domain-containing protein n=1 Tax=Pseudovirgaria hyperparasitica TaxID=470096 RepID=A0A6A6WHU9_9PEZI|nr:SNF5-domain-containing protein [Pseudovirgaria hyperparasitica]KAF2761675.1 SNF5-domain-containing protein [Pseudovirgaria hyperparasitica]
MMATTEKHPPQAFMSSYAPRLRQYGNSLLTPVIPQATALPTTRTTKRGTTLINYAEDGYDEDFDDSEGHRRPTGLRSLRRDETQQNPVAHIAQLGKELTAPVDVQGIWRDWMGKPKRGVRTEKQLQIQSMLPLTLIPITINLNIQSFRPDPALPTPHNAKDFGIDESLPAYKYPEPTPQYRLKDTFLWNLHEALMTPDQFAKVFVDEMDFPADRKLALVMQISQQIRQQLEEYAGVALHPLFHSTTATATDGTAVKQILPAHARADSSAPASARGGTPLTNGFKDASGTQTPSVAPASADVTLTANAIPEEDIHSPDDSYRCIIHLTINLQNRLYTDKFEWSLLHPPGFAEIFAKQTCADLGLAGEWIPEMTHAIYEAVLKLKKEACINGGLVGYGEIDNDAAGPSEAGWRYDHEHLADEWEPKVEILSKEEIEQREADRERDARRMRRDTARFSSTANMTAGVPQNDFFATPDASETPMGRGERSKKKRRFRSLSPVGRETPEAGYGGQGGGLQEGERQYWRCAHCAVWGTAVWAVRDGPSGPRTLCNNCGLLYERDKQLPPWSHNLYILETAFGTRRV